jgi:hypothetical protein
MTEQEWWQNTRMADYSCSLNSSRDNNGAPSLSLQIVCLEIRVVFFLILARRGLYGGMMGMTDMGMGMGTVAERE